jgi:hypothetical protein
MIKAYKNIQFMMMIAIAVIFSQVFISGMLLNFLIYTPYLKVKYAIYFNADSINHHTVDLHKALLSG